MLNGFMDEHYHHFDDEEENKFIYTDIFNLYVSCVLFVTNLADKQPSLSVCHAYYYLEKALSQQAITLGRKWKLYVVFK